MRAIKRILTLDSNVFIAALKSDEFYSVKCAEIIGKVPDKFLLSEPSIVYQEVCGTLARKVGADVADVAREQLDRMIHPKLLVNCDKVFCVSTYPLCSEHGIYAIDALYLKVALDNNAVLVSLDKEGFIEKLRSRRNQIEVYHASDFPY
ncbi:MAG: PIN domain-containing protein [Nitrososphaerales archaeon]